MTASAGMGGGATIPDVEENTDMFASFRSLTEGPVFIGLQVLMEKNVDSLIVTANSTICSLKVFYSCLVSLRVGRWALDVWATCCQCADFRGTFCWTRDCGSKESLHTQSLVCGRFCCAGFGAAAPQALGCES